MYDVNLGYFGHAETQVFLKEIQSLCTHGNIRNLDSEDREFISIACRAVETGKGVLTTWFPISDQRTAKGRDLSSSQIEQRFIQVKIQLKSTAGQVKDPSCWIVRLFKGIANCFGRESSLSLHNRVTSLVIP